MVARDIFAGADCFASEHVFKGCRGFLVVFSTFLAICLPDKGGDSTSFYNIMTKKENILSFMWQHILLFVSLYVMTLGVAVCVRSQLGSSVISTIPYVMESAGGFMDYIPAWTIGTYTIAMNAVFVVFQILILRRRFEWVQLFQLVIGFFFGVLIDLNMLLTEWLVTDNILANVLAQVAGCTILGIGIAMEVRCGSLTMPGEGITIAIHKVTGLEFPKAKICVDVSLVVIAVLLCFLLLGSWQWQIVGVGTLFAMVYVGMVVRGVSKHFGWFERLLAYRPGFRRYVYGLARYIFPPHH